MAGQENPFELLCRVSVGKGVRGWVWMKSYQELRSTARGQLCQAWLAVLIRNNTKLAKLAVSMRERSGTHAVSRF
eukprot:6200879-Pleurochrysis_carterae.AAC.2